MTATVHPDRQVELAIGGMTCASCATRVERKLNKLDGVTATVNYATEKARVTFPDSVTEADLLSTVAAAGYTARLPEPPAAPPPGAGSAGDAGPEAEDPETRTLRQRLTVSVVLAVPVIAMTMIPRCSSTTGSGSR
jgi:Cu+-exporting ATPase